VSEDNPEFPPETNWPEGDGDNVEPLTDPDEWEPYEPEPS